MKAQKLVNAQNLRGLCAFIAGSSAPQESSPVTLSTETLSDGRTIRFSMRNGKREGEALQTYPTEPRSKVDLCGMAA